MLAGVRGIGTGIADLSLGVIQLGGYGGAIVALVLLGATSYVYAIRRFETYQIS